LQKEAIMFFVNEFLKSLEVEPPQKYHNLTIYPLKSKLASEVDILSLDEAMEMENDAIEISEVQDDGGVVSSLFFKSKIDKAIYISGMILGNLQDRVVKTDFILKPFEERTAEVACVESTRWGNKQKRSLSEYPVFSNIKPFLRKSDQEFVWQKVREKASSMKVESERTEDIYLNHKESIDDFKKHFYCRQDYVGMVVCLDDRCYAMEIYAIKGLFPKMFSSLINGYVFDALDKQQHYDLLRRKKLTVSQFLSETQNTEMRFYETEQGERVFDLKAEGIIGDALAIEQDKLVRLASFLA
jgi:hypothetical protein